MSPTMLFTRVSRNKKTGPIPVTTTSAETCPTTCGLFNDCYAKSGPLLQHWNKLTKGIHETALSWSECMTAIRNLPKGALWRHNQAGDLPGENGTIDKGLMLELISANRGKRGFTFSHKPMHSEVNRDLVRFANQSGFTVNLSADNIEQADALAALAIGPVVVVVPSDTKAALKTPHGRTVAMCPAELTQNRIQCDRCGLCAMADRKAIIGFPAHGNRKRGADAVAKGKAA